MELEHAEGAAPGGWDEAVGASDDAWLFHTVRWIEGTAQVWPLENHYFTVTDGGRIVGGWPVQRAPGGRRPWAWPRAYSTKMGPAVFFAVRELESADRNRVLALLHQGVMAWTEQARVGAVECALPPLAPANLANASGPNPLVALGWQDRSTHTMIRLLEDFALESLPADTRRRIRRATEQGYTVRAEPWAELLDAYYAVHVENYGRTGVAPHPRAYFELIARELAPAGQAVLWVCRTAAGEPVAFHNSGRYGGGAVYWTSCARQEAAAANANYLLFWHALQGAGKAGCTHYDIGEVFPGATQGKQQGLSIFKSKFGGELHRYYRAEYPLKPRGWRWGAVFGVRC